MPDNPYQMPASPPPFPPRRMQLASIGKRLLGAILDSMVAMLAMLPGFVVMIISLIAVDANENGPSSDLPVIGIFAGIGVLMLGLFIVMAFQIYFHYKSSQSIGKYFLKMQIIDFNTGQPSPFVNCFLLRILVNALLGQIPMYGIIDVLLIFREDRRCIHDLIASTTVVDLD